MDSHPNQSSARKLVPDTLAKIGANLRFRTRRQAPQYIFFTGWGCIFVTMTGLMFLYAIFYQIEALVFYSLLSGVCLLFGLLFTHENLRSTKIQKLSCLVDYANQNWLFRIEVTNFSAQTRKRLKVKLKLTTDSGEKHTFLGAAIPLSSACAAATTRFDLHAFESNEFKLIFDPQKKHSKQGNHAYQIASLTLESTYALGLMRSWRVFKPRDLAGHPESFLLPPRKIKTEADEQSFEEDTISWSETPYTNQNPSRILWKRFAQNRELFARHEESRPLPNAKETGSNGSSKHLAATVLSSQQEHEDQTFENWPRAAIMVQKFLLFFFAAFWALENLDEFLAAKGGYGWILAASLPFVAIFSALAQSFISAQSFPVPLLRPLVSISRLMTLIFPMLMGYLAFYNDELPRSDAEALGLELFPILFLMASFRHATSAPFSAIANSVRTEQKHADADAFTSAGLLLLTGCPLFIASAAKQEALAQFAAAAAIFGCYYSLYLTQIRNKSRYFEFEKTDAQLLTRVFLQATPLVLILAGLFAFVPDALKNFDYFKRELQKSDNSLTGFGTNLRPGAAALLKDDDRPALSLAAVPDALDHLESKSWLEGLKDKTYLRGATLSKGFGFTWQQGTADYFTLQKATVKEPVRSVPLQQASFAAAHALPSVKIVTALREPLGGNLFVPAGFHVTKFSQKQNEYPWSTLSKASQARLIGFRPHTYMVFGAHPRQELIYEIAPLTTEELTDQPLQDHFYSEELARKEPDTQDLDDAIAQDEGFRNRFQKSTDSTQEILHKVESFFRERSFTYARKNTSKDLKDFLFGSKRGYCEHFAAAAASIFRFKGLAARIVTGYAGGHYDAASKKVVFLNSEAHAWLEVWLPEKGQWLRVDPTQWAAFSEYQKSTSASFGFGTQIWALVVLMLLAILLFGSVSFSKRTHLRKQLESIKTQEEAVNPEKRRLENEISQVFKGCFGKARQSHETFREYTSRITLNDNVSKAKITPELAAASQFAQIVCANFEKLSYGHNEQKQDDELQQQIKLALEKLRQLQINAKDVAKSSNSWKRTLQK